MKFFVFILVAMATIVSCENMQMIELTSAVSSSSNCDVSLWCQDRATAERCDKVSYCTKWIWGDVPVQDLSTSSCDLCKEIFQGVLADNATEIDIICKVFFSDDQNCSAQLHKLIDGETPEKVCHYVGVCPQSADFVVTNAHKFFVSEVQKQPGLPTDDCDLCKEIIQDLLAKNATEIDVICKVFFSNNPNCSAQLHKLIEGETPETVCHRIDICPQSADFSVTNALKFFVSDDECDSCKEIIRDLLDDNATKIDTVCRIFFSADQNCRAELHKLIEGVTPEKFCHRINLCPQSADFVVTNALKFFVSEVQKQPGLPTDECDVCKQIIDLLLNNTDTFKKILEGLCGKVKTIKIPCDFLVDEIISILNKQNSTTLCSDIKLCSLPPPQLLGADMCTRGPAYWCASLSNAKECNALEFCEEKYWM
ncbi:Proactivator polypeptide-like 1 precursor [Oopsacas minuta]|uniref:Proactivator polypeptide-like 1 n=1 Tax=Oopsacas minuta TaxID=111878 RepID=A0AAV7K5X4_9METZ|nr:Proactivator polypeptide-like 1 precursor [Oopsacas minuta]